MNHTQAFGMSSALCGEPAERRTTVHIKKIDPAQKRKRQDVARD